MSDTVQTDSTTAQQTVIPGIPAVPNGGSLLDWVVQQYLGAKIQKEHILNQNGANLVYNHGRDIAKKLGLDTAGITPFPANTTINVEQTPAQSQPTAPQTSTLQKLAMSAALVTAGAGIPYLAGAAIDAISPGTDAGESQQITEPAANTETIPEAQVINPEVGFEIR